MRRQIHGFTAGCLTVGLALGGLMVGGLVCGADEKAETAKKETKIELKDVPPAAMEAVKKLFPTAEVLGAEQETKGKKTIYEVKLKDKDQNIEVLVETDGDIEGVEREIDLKKLPKEVIDAIEAKYPKSTLKEAEAVSEIENGKEELEYYEVELETADKKMVEVHVTPAGKIQAETDEKDDKDEKEEKK